MEVRPMEITLISANGLRNVRIFSEMDVYGKVSVLGDPGWMKKQKQKTPVHRNGGSNAEWNHKMTFIINEGAAQQNLLTLKVKIKTKRTLRNSTSIFTVRFPIKKLFDEKDEVTIDEYFSHNITSDGESLGTLCWKCKFGETFTVVQGPPGGSSSGRTMVQLAPAVMNVLTLLGAIILDD